MILLVIFCLFYFNIQSFFYMQPSTYIFQDAVQRSEPQHKAKAYPAYSGASAQLYP